MENEETIKRIQNIAYVLHKNKTVCFSYACEDCGRSATYIIMQNPTSVLKIECRILLNRMVLCGLCKKQTDDLYSFEEEIDFSLISWELEKWKSTISSIIGEIERSLGEKT